MHIVHIKEQEYKKQGINGNIPKEYLDYSLL